MCFVSKKEIDGITFFNVDLPKRKDYDVTFIKYLNFFTNFIYEKKLTPVAVAELRKKLGLDKSTVSKITSKSNITKLLQIIK